MMRPIMNSLHHNSGEFSRLKSLLLKEEQQVLAEIEQVVRRHDARVGDDEALQHSVADILANSLREADIKNHRELAAAIAPVIVAAIRREIRNASDEVVDALYPIMGRLIRAYVSSAIRDFVEQTNRRIEGGLSASFVRLRIKSLLTRTPYRTLLIREGQDLRIASIYLIDRSSGTLMEAWNADPAAPESLGDDHLIGGMLTAINNFAAESLAERDSELRALDLGESRVYLRASAAYLVAMKSVGKGNRRIRRAIDTELGHTLEKLTDFHQEGTLQRREVLAELADGITALLANYKQPPILALAVFGGLTVLAGLIAYQGYREKVAVARLAGEVRAVIDSRAALQAFPLRIDVASDRSAVTVAGLVPSEADRDAFVKAAAARLDPVKLTPQLIVVPALSEYMKMSGTVADLNSRLSGSVADLNALVAKVEEEASLRTAAEVAATRAEIGDVDKQLKASTAALTARLDELHRITQDPHLKLSQWVATHAIFYADGAQFRDHDMAIATLGQLRDLLDAATNARIRIIGYTDPTGTADGNDALATQRAEQVAGELEKLGVSRTRMKILGRPRGILLSYDKGPYSSNRRVEFELAYIGEPTKPAGEPLAADGTSP